MILNVEGLTVVGFEGLWVLLGIQFAAFVVDGTHPHVHIKDPSLTPALFNTSHAISPKLVLPRLASALYTLQYPCGRWPCTATSTTPSSTLTPHSLDASAWVL